MIKLTLPEGILDSGLAMPESTPRTLIEVDNENLPYACQCPLCGGLFNIPEGLLYKVEEDALLDGDFDVAAEPEGGSELDINVDSGMSDTNESAPMSSGTAEVGVGEVNDSII